MKMTLSLWPLISLGGCASALSPAAFEGAPTERFYVVGAGLALRTAAFVWIGAWRLGWVRRRLAPGCRAASMRIISPGP
jgi:hypothetical protein